MPFLARVSTVPAVHRQLLDRCQPLDNAAAIPAQRKAGRGYANRVTARLGSPEPVVRQLPLEVALEFAGGGEGLHPCPLATRVPESCCPP
ncbi:hypothetical protein ACH40F_12330 [Streptomyces sp. NPDC020794]|uniref:hypothetical protein n=1 Tax=unclassified Streptomyces TaxID=2593676 RepID=UPI0036EF0978